VSDALNTHPTIGVELQPQTADANNLRLRSAMCWFASTQRCDLKRYTRIRTAQELRPVRPHGIGHMWWRLHCECAFHPRAPKAQLISQRSRIWYTANDNGDLTPLRLATITAKRKELNAAIQLDTIDPERCKFASNERILRKGDVIQHSGVDVPDAFVVRHVQAQRLS